MWLPGQYYYALPKGVDKENIDEWIIVQCVGTNSIFKRIGSTHVYNVQYYERVTTVPINLALSIIKAGNGEAIGDGPSAHIQKILGMLRTLKDDFEGNISITDPDRDRTIQQIFNHLNHIP